MWLWKKTIKVINFKHNTTYLRKCMFFSLLMNPKKTITFKADLCFTAFFGFFEIRPNFGEKFCTIISSRPKFIMSFKISKAFPKKNKRLNVCKSWPDFGLLQDSLIGPVHSRLGDKGYPSRGQRVPLARRGWLDAAGKARKFGDEDLR